MRVAILIVTTTLFWLDYASSKPLSGLYEPEDNVTILNQDNFDKILFNSSVIWIVEFYSSWCGHCQEYAPLYKAFAKDLKGWNQVLRLAVMRCDSDISYDEHQTCNWEPFWLSDFPQMRVFHPFSNFSNQGENFKASRRTGDFRGQMVQLVEKYLDQVEWKLKKLKPNFSFINYKEIENHLNKNADQPYYLTLVIENEESKTGREIILDTSSCKNITVRRLKSNSNVAKKLSSDYTLSFTEYPHVVVLTRHGKILEINVKIRERSFFTYKLEELPGVGDPKILPNLNSAAMVTKEDSNYVDWTEVDHSRVYLADLESALRYSLAVEIPSVKIIDGDALDALKTYIGTLALLSENLPFRPPTKRFLVMLNAWLGGRVMVKYEDWKRRIEVTNFELSEVGEAKLNTYALIGILRGPAKSFLANWNFELSDFETNNYLPSTSKRWVGCAPSSPHLRGYPCSLWTLFHVLTVAGYVQENKDDFDIPDVELVPRAMEAYITAFFGCRECSTNFAKEIASSPYKNTLKNHRDAIMWLWRLHNNVNKRLHGAISEDPQFPKIQFPSPMLCPGCKNSDRSWNEEKVLDFLASRYSPDNVSFKFLPDISEDNLEAWENQDNLFISEFDENEPDELQIQHVLGRLEDDHDFDGGDAKDNDEEYEKIGKGSRFRGEYVGHPNLLQELAEDRVKSHAVDELRKFGGDGRKFHPRDISGKNWHNGYGPGSVFSDIDVSMCVMLWGTSMFAVFFLYYFVKRRRKCNIQ